ncbi:hypothetical protein JTB14_018214 [Gonioctena quinquepunctata]|nr:hypothetical protein JTB14_018214 [Gonioctena quinquepunctata]
MKANQNSCAQNYNANKKKLPDLKGPVVLQNSIRNWIPGKILDQKEEPDRIHWRPIPNKERTEDEVNKEETAVPSYEEKENDTLSIEKPSTSRREKRIIKPPARFKDFFSTLNKS